MNLIENLNGFLPPFCSFKKKQQQQIILIMGWTSKNCNYNHNDFTVEKAAEILREEFSNNSKIHKAYLKQDKEQHEIYCLYENTHTNSTCILVILVFISENEIYWKDTTDSMHPFYYNCPVDILTRSESSNEDSIKWRHQCRLVNAKLPQIPL